MIGIEASSIKRRESAALSPVFFNATIHKIFMSTELRKGRGIHEETR